MPTPYIPLASKFVANTQIVLTGCWQWTGAFNWNGYARMTNRGKNIRAHRWAYEAYRSPIPEGLVLDHLCRNRACVNPYHLEPVTMVENLNRGIRTNQMAKMTHCKRGHELTPENTCLLGSKGGRKQRLCKTCASLRKRQRYIATRNRIADEPQEGATP